MTRRLVPIRATFSIHGMRGPHDELALENSIATRSGILSVEVRSDLHAAKIEFAEEIISLQAVARLIAEHDRSNRAEPLVACVLLKVPSVSKDATAGLPVHVLHKVRGVEDVTLRVDQQALEVRLKLDGDLTTQDLVRALAVEGIASNVM